MPDEKAPPPHDDKPDYNPEPPARERLGDDNPKIDEYDPPRNRNASSVAVITTVIVVLLLAVAYFMFRGG